MTPFVIVIPARYGATRLPGKPLVMLAGRPLLRHTYECALDTGAKQVLIATDDDRVAQAAAGFNAEVMLTSAHHACGTDRLAEVARRMGWADETIVVNLQGDEPLTPPLLLAQVAEDLAGHADAAIATLCTPFRDTAARHNPNVVKLVRDAHGYALYFSRAPIPYQRDGEDPTLVPATLPHYRHIGIYAYRAAYLARFEAREPAPLEQVECLEQLRALWHGERIYAAQACVLPGPGVDTPADVEQVAALLQNSRY